MANSKKKDVTPIKEKQEKEEKQFTTKDVEDIMRSLHNVFNVSFVADIIMVSSSDEIIKTDKFTRFETLKFVPQIGCLFLNMYRHNKRISTLLYDNSSNLFICGLETFVTHTLDDFNEESDSLYKDGWNLLS